MNSNDQRKRKIGRPASPQGRGAPVLVTIPRPLLARVDQYRHDNFAGKRPDAIRELVARGLERVR